MRIRDLIRERRRCDSERGITLVELLVAVVIFGILLTIVSSFVTTSMRVVSSSQALSQATGPASNAMNEITRVIRSGATQPVVGQQLPNPVFVAASAESVTLYSFVDSYVNSTSTQTRPQLVQFLLVNRQLVEKRWLPVTSNGAYFTFPDITKLPTPMPATARTIAGPIVTTPTGQSPLFTYQLLNGTVTVAPTAAQLGSITGVKVTVRVTGDNDPSHPAVTLQNTVGIPNLGTTGG